MSRRLIDGIKTNEHPLYNTWNALKQLCYNPKRPYYCYYGDKYIIMCDEWANSFKAYYDWAIENGWKKGLRIVRIDKDGDFEPSNCRVTDRVKRIKKTAIQ
jgi:hypothetical protein